MINIETGTKDDGGYIGKLTFQNGNLVMNEYSYYGAERFVLYEYDVKNNNNKDILGFNQLIAVEGNVSSVNNVVAKTNNNGTTSYAYTYNSNGYPVEEIATYPNGSTERIQYLY